MIVDAVLFRLVLIALAACPSTALALNTTFVDRNMCFRDGVVVSPPDHRIPIPVGCRRVDCCPGCPGPGPLKWQITLNGGVLEGAELRLDGLSSRELKRLKLSGHAKVAGDRIILRRGRSTISGIPDEAAGKVVVGSLVPLASSEPRVQRASSTRPERGRVGAHTSARDQITVQQFLGSFAVDRFRTRHVVAACAVPIAMASPVEDRLRIVGIASGDEVAVMLDARTSAGSAGCGNDQIFRSSGDRRLGNLLPAAGCNSEVAIFSEKHSMVLETVNTWTNVRGDLHTVTLQPMIDVPVSVWIANDAAAAKAVADMNKANDLYRANKVGIRFVPTFTRVVDVSTDPNAITIVNAGIGTGPSGLECQNIAAIQQRAFYTANTLNVYYVNESFTGRNCAILQTPSVCTNDSTAFPPGDGNITFIGSMATSTTLAHEFGHAFGLRPASCGGHTESLSDFGPDNIMAAGGGDERVHFSLGQVFRMNTHTDAWGGTMLIQNGLRTAPARACQPHVTDARCPALGTAWPP